MFRPVMKHCIWIIPLVVVCQSRGYEPRGCKSAFGNQDGLARRFPTARIWSSFWFFQDWCGFPNLHVSSAMCRGPIRTIVTEAFLIYSSLIFWRTVTVPQSGVVYVSRVNRSVNDAVAHSTDEVLLVLNVFLMKANEHIVPRYFELP